MPWFSKVFLCHQSALMVTTALLQLQILGFIDALLAITMIRQPLPEVPASLTRLVARLAWLPITALKLQWSI